MTLGNKAGSAVVCILFALLLVMQGIVVKSMLEEPEFYGPEIIISDDGEVSYGGEMEPNPNYIPEGSPKRAFYNFLMDFHTRRTGLADFSVRGRQSQQNLSL